MPDDQSPQNQDVAVTREQCQWERDWKTKPFEAYVQTVWQVLSSPVKTFERIKPFEDLFSLAVFIYINTFIGLFVTMVLQLAYSAAFDPTAGLIQLPFLLCGMVFFPIALVILNFIISAIFHMFYVFVGGSQKSYATTVTVHGLGSVVQFFAVLYVLGTIAEVVYGVIFAVFGQAKAHEISPLRALFSVLVPGLICCCVAFLSAMALSTLFGGLSGIEDWMMNLRLKML